MNLKQRNNGIWKVLIKTRRRRRWLWRRKKVTTTIKFNNYKSILYKVFQSLKLNVIMLWSNIICYYYYFCFCDFSFSFSVHRPFNGWRHKWQQLEHEELNSYLKLLYFIFFCSFQYDYSSNYQLSFNVTISSHKHIDFEKQSNSIYYRTHSSFMIFFFFLLRKSQNVY